MPEVSRFFGIVINMYADEHPPTHFHATYGEHTALIAVETFEVREGFLPNRQLRMVEGWAALHQEELQANWERLQAGEKAVRIEPLR